MRGFLSEAFVSFQGEGQHVGRRQLFVRFAGCNLRCRYCDTPASLERTARFVVGANGRSSEVPNPVSLRDLGSLALDLLDREGPVDGVALTGGEPLLQWEYLRELLQAEWLPRPRMLETNGMLADRLASVLSHVDVVSMDIKLPSNTGEPAFWKDHETFLGLCREKVYVKILVDRDTKREELTRAAELVREVSPEVPVYLQPISRPDGTIDLSGERLGEIFALLRGHLADVRVIPQTHRMLAIP